MLDITFFFNISVCTYQQEILPIFIEGDSANLTRPLDWVKAEENIQDSMLALYKENTDLWINIFQLMLPTFTLES